MANFTNISIIIGREFNERVRKKSFVVVTILMPLLMVGLSLAPALIMRYSHGDVREIVVLDRSGIVAPQLEDGGQLRFEPSDLPLDEARKAYAEKFGVLEIGADILSDPSAVRLYTSRSSSLAVESALSSRIGKIVEQHKLRSYDIENLEQILADVRTDIDIQVFRDDDGEARSSSSAVFSAVGFVLGFVLYMFLLIYGSMVMQSVIEEKNSRVLEVMVSSVRPFELMMGKILGVAAVAVVQIVIWTVLVAGVGSVVVPMVVPSDVMQAVEAVNSGAMGVAESGISGDMLSALTLSMDIGYILKLFGLVLLFMVGGYLLYSSMFAAVGSAVDNVQDAGQLQTPLMVPIILSIIAMTAVVGDPDSTLAFWFSVIPFTSPIVMVARIPYGIPAWEIVLSLVLLYATFVGMVWLAAKIYRVGIFMYGKKPTLREMLRWVRYRA